MGAALVLRAVDSDVFPVAVLPPGDGFKVSHTQPDTASVIDVVSVGNWADQQLVREPMRAFGTLVPPHLRVSVLHDRPSPHQVSVSLLNVGPEMRVSTFFDFRGVRASYYGGTRKAPHAIVRVTPTTCPSRAGTVRDRAPRTSCVVSDLSIASYHGRQILRNRLAPGDGTSRWWWKLDRRTLRRSSVSYAKYHHERLDLHHPRGGGPKYLEGPLFANYQDYLQRIADGLLHGGPAQAMADCMEALNTAMSRSAPIEFNNLRRSGSPRVYDNGRKVYDRAAWQGRLSREELRLLRRGRRR